MNITFNQNFRVELYKSFFDVSILSSKNTFNCGVQIIPYDCFGYMVLVKFGGFTPYKILFFENKELFKNYIKDEQITDYEIIWEYGK